MATQAIDSYLTEITVAKTAHFTADGDSGTVYVVTPASADVEITLEASAVGIRYTFLNLSADHDLRVLPATGETIKFWSEAGSDVDTVTGGNDEWLQVDLFGSATILKASATNWAVVSGNGFRYND